MGPLKKKNFLIMYRNQSYCNKYDEKGFVFYSDVLILYKCLLSKINGLKKYSKRSIITRN